MSFSRFNKFKELYFTALPLMIVYPIIVSIDTGLYANRKNPELNSIDIYSNLIGYTMRQVK